MDLYATGCILASPLYRLYRKYRLLTFDECSIENIYYYEYKRFDYYRIICTYYNTGGVAKRKRKQGRGLEGTGQ